MIKKHNTKKVQTFSELLPSDIDNSFQLLNDNAEKIYDTTYEIEKKQKEISLLEKKLSFKPFFSLNKTSFYLSFLLFISTLFFVINISIYPFLKEQLSSFHTEDSLAILQNSLAKEFIESNHKNIQDFSFNDIKYDKDFNNFLNSKNQAEITFIATLNQNEKFSNFFKNISIVIAFNLLLTSYLIPWLRNRFNYKKNQTKLNELNDIVLQDSLYVNQLTEEYSQTYNQLNAITTQETEQEIDVNKVYKHLFSETHLSPTLATFIIDNCVPYSVKFNINPLCQKTGSSFKFSEASTKISYYINS